MQFVSSFLSLTYCYDRSFHGRNPTKKFFSLKVLRTWVWRYAFHQTQQCDDAGCSYCCSFLLGWHERNSQVQAIDFFLPRNIGPQWVHIMCSLERFMDKIVSLIPCRSLWCATMSPMKWWVYSQPKTSSNAIMGLNTLKRRKIKTLFGSIMSSNCCEVKVPCHWSMIYQWFGDPCSDL